MTIMEIIRRIIVIIIRIAKKIRRKIRKESFPKGPPLSFASRLASEWRVNSTLTPIFSVTALLPSQVSYESSPDSKGHFHWNIYSEVSPLRSVAVSVTLFRSSISTNYLGLPIRYSSSGPIRRTRMGSLCSEVIVTFGTIS